MPRRAPVSLDNVFAEIDQMESKLNQSMPARGNRPRSAIDTHDLTLADIAALNQGSHENVSHQRGILDGGSSNVGRAVTIKDDGSGQTIDVLNLEGSDEKGKVLTISFFGPPALATPNGALPTFDLIAVIDYGSGGVRTTVEVDYVRGAVFQVPGSSVRIGVKAAHQTGALGSVATVGAFAVELPTARVSRLVRSFPLGVLAAAGSKIIAIPPFATEAQVAVFANGGYTGGLFGVCTRDGVAHYSASFAKDAPSAILPIAGSMDFLEIDNNAAGPGFADGRAIFTIEL